MLSKKSLQKRIKEDKENYLTKNFIKKIYYYLVKHEYVNYFNYLVCCRKIKYYKNNFNILNGLKCFYYSRKKYILGSKVNLDIGNCIFGKNLKIYHSNIVINPNVIIGDNCKLHGNNCIGNKSISNECPTIGNNVDIGFGAVIIGNVKIGDNIIIGANSVVTKNFEEENVVIAGNPAKIIKRY